jgi:hypothetical protein
MFTINIRGNCVICTRGFYEDARKGDAIRKAGKQEEGWKICSLSTVN